MDVRGAGVVAVPLLAVAGVVQWWSGTAPVLALVASYVAVLLALERVLPGRVAPAAALLAQLGCYLLLLVVAPLVLGGPLRPGVALAILLAPCLAVTAGLRRGADRERHPVPWPLVAAASAGGVVMVATVLLAGREDAYGAIAWTTSGDARNHLIDARGVLTTGGLRGHSLGGRPMLQEALTGLLLDTHGRAHLGPGEQLHRDLVGYATASAVLTVLWTWSTTALLSAFGRLRRRAWPVVLVASLLPLTGLALGVTIRDGFVPILLLQPLLLSAVGVLAWLATAEDDGTGATLAVGLTALALPLAAATWTPFFAVLAGAVALPWWQRLRSGRQRTARLVLMSVGTAAGSAICLSVIASSDGYVTLPGSITAPAPLATALPPFLVGVVALAGWSRVPRRAFLPFLLGSVTALGIVAYAVVVQPPGQAWNYYPSKVAWIWAAASVPLLLVPFAHPPAGAVRVRAGAGAAAVLLLALALSPVNSPVLPSALAWAQTGLRPVGTTIGTWDQPDAASLRLVERLADPRRSYVVYAVAPEDDRLTNFWLALYDRHEPAFFGEEFIRWGYVETGTAQDVCDLLRLQPERVVATADPAAEEQLEALCDHDVRVRLLRS